MPALARLAITGLLCVATASCASTPAATPTSASSAPTESLRDRAERLWEARRDEDWPVVFEFHRSRHVATSEEFARWSIQNEPFVVHEFELGDAATESDIGWVHVRCRTSMRRFPNTPARETNRWERWRVEDNAWFPVPPPEYGFYPEPPTKRDGPAEVQLRARFDASWEARRVSDWATLYAMLDPHDEVDEGLFTHTIALVDFLECDVDWVEVIGTRGRVRVTYERKLTDPSLTKLPAEDTVILEEWILRDGTWYLDR